MKGGGREEGERVKERALDLRVSVSPSAVRCPAARSHGTALRKACSPVHSNCHCSLSICHNPGSHWSLLPPTASIRCLRRRYYATTLDIEVDPQRRRFCRLVGPVRNPVLDTGWRLVFLVSSRLRIEPKAPGWLVQGLVPVVGDQSGLVPFGTQIFRVTVAGFRPLVMD